MTEQEFEQYKRKYRNRKYHKPLQMTYADILERRATIRQYLLEGYSGSYSRSKAGCHGTVSGEALFDILMTFPDVRRLYDLAVGAAAVKQRKRTFKLL